MGVHIETDADVAILHLRGNFCGDRETQKLRTVVRQLASDGNTKLAIDLGGVHRLNSMALSVLVEMHTNYVKRRPHHPGQSRQAYRGSIDHHPSGARLRDRPDASCA